MLAIALSIALFTALWRALRARHPIAIIGTIGAGYALATDGANAVAVRNEEGHLLQGFLFVFLGPSGVIGRERGALPTPAVGVTHPVVVHLVIVVIVVLLVALIGRESGALRPELPRARALDAITMPLVAIGVMEAILIAIHILMTHLADVD